MVAALDDVWALVSTFVYGGKATRPGLCGEGRSHLSPGGGPSRLGEVCLNAITGEIAQQFPGYLCYAGSTGVTRGFGVSSFKTASTSDVVARPCCAD